MDNKKFDKKLLKRCVFLRKLLEQYGIKWELKLEKIDENKTVMSFLPTFNGLNLYYNIDKPSVNLYNVDRFYNENKLDLNFGLTLATLSLFNAYGNANTTYNEYNKVKKILASIIVYSAPNSMKYAIEQIDFEHTVQNQILDGMSFEGFPALEEVL